MSVDTVVLERVRDEARRRGVRWTTQRQVILETIADCTDHLTVEALHGLVKQRDDSVSPATVYRTVNMLVEMGVVSKRNFESASASFEWNLTKHHHDHLICTECGSVTEFEDDRIEAIQEEIAATFGFSLGHHRLELFGICSACRKNDSSNLGISDNHRRAAAKRH